MSYIWYEKYRPHSLEDMELPESVYNRLNQYITDQDIPNLLFYGPAGGGKCLGKGTPILMHNGTIKNVEDIIKGDLLMGPDSKSRLVLSTTKGQDELFNVIPTKGSPFVGNKSHILSLQSTGTEKITNISIADYLDKSANFKWQHKLWRIGVDFKERTLDTIITPYMLGVWLGDGSSAIFTISNPDKEIIKEIYDFAKAVGIGIREELITINGKKKCPNYFLTDGKKGGISNILTLELRKLNLVGNKHIPNQFKINRREIQLEVLAGLLDTDGYFHHGFYEITSKYKTLSDDIVFIARSLGFAAYQKAIWKKAQGWEEPKLYYSVSISGDCSVIPCRVERKKAEPRRQIKSVLRTGITIQSIGMGEYFGFEIDGDGLFLLGDFTVTHNTTVAQILLDKIPNQSLKLNASNDRSMEVMRDQVIRFSHSQPMPGTIKIVFMDEADGLLKGSQDLLRGAIEKVSDHCRFIFAANYPNKLSDPILSRFQKIRFKGVEKGTLLKHLSKILVSEKVKFSVKDLHTFFDLFFPDIRTIINSLQLCSVNGVLDLVHLQEMEDAVAFVEVSAALTTGNLRKIRELVAGQHDFQQYYKLLFDTFIYSIPEEVRPSVAVTIAEYLYKDEIIVDKEINFAAMMVEIMHIIGVEKITF